ncbi:N-acetyltransferase [Paenibacillus marchantiophytorum]|uniref:N-acetyltransferase n=1 Tax=Paenibacillus marchantiophytorum TaxID=1619310 RepID=A0ABQ1FI35_9BACL|nr:GNAT family N-acetyltransferase [Paenibacillus marchantiophytorum]GGA12709.1 N-acetyltransferase [Paenibacillus marchantiophytorum]
MPPVVTLDLAKRIEQAEIHTLESRLTAIGAKAGNPQGVYIQKFGAATAFLVKGVPDPYFNSVRGLTSENADVIEDILAFYREHEASCRFHLIPGQVTELARKLSAKGYFQSAFHSSLYGSSLSNERSESSNLTIRAFTEEDFDVFGQIYVKGFQMPSDLHQAVAQNNEVLYRQSGWHYYLAAINDVPVAVASLHIQDGVGSFAAAVTLPEYRKQGCHTALLLHRAAVAGDLECDLLVGQASYGSASQNNMERMGMRLAYTKSIWSKI